MTDRDQAAIDAGRSHAAAVDGAAPPSQPAGLVGRLQPKAPPAQGGALAWTVLLYLPEAVLTIGAAFLAALLLIGLPEPGDTTPSVDGGEPEPRWCGRWCP